MAEGFRRRTLASKKWKIQAKTYKPKLVDCWLCMRLGFIPPIFLPLLLFVRLGWLHWETSGDELGCSLQVTSGPVQFALQRCCLCPSYPRGLTFTWWGCYGLCLWHKPTKLAHSFLFCSCIYFCLSLRPFQLYFIPQILPTTLHFLTLFFRFLSLPYWSFQLCLFMKVSCNPINNP